MFPMHPKFALLLAAILLAVVPGCSTVRLYSEARDKQGQSAKTAWSAVDLTGVIAVERQNLDKLLQEELKTQEMLATGIRDHRLRALVAGESVEEGLVTPVEKALVEIAGSGQLVRDSRVRFKDRLGDTAKLQGYGVEFVGLSVRAPDCADLEDDAKMKAIEKWGLDAPAKDKTRVDRAIVKIRATCSLGTLKPLYVYQGMGGSIATTLEQYAADHAALTAANASAAPLRKSYEEAAAAYKEAVKQASADTHADANLSKALTKLSEAAAALDRATDPFSAELISSERLKAIGDFADAVTEGKPGESLSQSQKRAAMAFALLPGLMDEARASLASTRKPLALPLLMRSNHERLKLQAATKEIEARETMARLSRESLETLYETAVQLWLASETLNSDEIKPLHPIPATKAFLSGDPNDREQLFMAAIRYLDTLDRLSARRYKLEYSRIAASDQLALSYAEANVQQWGSLIGLTVEQVADASASGIKAEKVSALLDALGVLWIGHGVNK